MSINRLKHMPEEIRREIRQARVERGWSQLALGREAGLTQRHISEIEAGKIVPRYDTLIEVLRVLDRDLVLVPRELLPVVRATVRNYGKRGLASPAEPSLYAVADDGDDYGDE